MVPNNSDRASVRILDIGCGQGIVGAYVLYHGIVLNNIKYTCNHIKFQDYNKDVIDQLTKNTVKANLDQWSDSQFDINNDIIHYVSGGWDSLAEHCTGNDTDRFEWILMSDTIYNEENYHSLYKYIRANLALSGVWLWSCQVYYYGVGGGDQAFKDYVNKYQEFKILDLKEYSDGKSIDRLILQISWIPEKFTNSLELKEISNEAQDEQDFLLF